jgi:hypothetical protein
MKKCPKIFRVAVARSAYYPTVGYGFGAQRDRGVYKSNLELEAPTNGPARNLFLAGLSTAVRRLTSGDEYEDRIKRARRVYRLRAMPSRTHALTRQRCQPSLF